MGILVILFIIIFLGAMDGGNSFGETIRKGCGCLTFFIFFVIIVLAYMGGHG